jgi:hypothetical protein
MSRYKETVQRPNGDVIDNVWGMGKDHLRAHFHSKAVQGAREELGLIGHIKAHEEAELKKKQPYEPQSYSMPNIVREICAYRGMSKSEMKSASRTFAVTAVRHEVAYWLRVRGGATYPQIARLTGRTNHTTAIHACRAYARLHGLEVPAGDVK